MESESLLLFATKCVGALCLFFTLLTIVMKRYFALSEKLEKLKDSLTVQSIKALEVTSGKLNERLTLAEARLEEKFDLLTIELSKHRTGMLRHEDELKQVRTSLDQAAKHWAGQAQTEPTKTNVKQIGAEVFRVESKPKKEE